MNGVVCGTEEVASVQPGGPGNCGTRDVNRSRPVADVARDCGVTDQTIRNWVKQFHRANSAADTGLSMPERARLKELERRVRELEEENRFLGNRWPSSRRSTCRGHAPSIVEPQQVQHT
ncbi:transposase [Nocardia sp. NPDC101769]|uniref:transposase n=1 Tax=Nocardia sp. NPDC101769 TaxID=3364333 RepID=UPI0037F7BF89